MYNKYRPWSLYFQIFIITIIIIYLFIFLYLFYHQSEEESQHNLKIIDIPVNGVKFKKIAKNVLTRFQDVFILNGSYTFLKEGNNKKRVDKKLEFDNGTSVDLPFISPNLIDTTTEDLIPVAGFKTVINSFGDFTFINDIGGDVSWNSNSDFIKKRTPDQTFLIDDETRDKDLKHYLYLNVIRYIYKGNQAVHVNYIVKKTGMSKNNVSAFIKFLNWFQHFTNKHNCFYFSISGNSNIRSAKWRKIAKKVFKDSCYISPGIESHFITDYETKYGGRASRFMIISKPLAPFGVYFYVSQQKIDNLSSYSNILVAEILQKKNYKKSKNDETELIFKKFTKERHVNPLIRIDFETSNDVNLEKYDFNEFGFFKPLSHKKVSEN